VGPEYQTRKEIIDKRLAEAGWDVENPTLVVSEQPVGYQATATGQGYIDYVLLASDRTPIAVVEAKKSTTDAEKGREQAKQYADGLMKEGNQRPFILYTNGYDIFFWDDRRYPPRKVYGFFTKDDLERLRFQDQESKPLSAILINKDIAGRPYQIEAIRRVLEALSNSRRKALLVMATGTGKTRVAMALIDVLMRSNWVKRVLFLADRNELLKQANNAFKEHLPNAPRVRISSKNCPHDKRVYLATYPAMHKLYPKFSPAFFDLIIADESHRSIYKRYKEIFDHFDSYQLGLTATPIDFIERNTFKMFETDDGEPTYAYTLDEAIENDPPYLVNFKVLNVRTRFQLEGIKAGQLPTAIQKKLVEEGKDLEEIDFEGTDLEKKVSNSGTNELIVREFMENCIRDASGTKPGKSIIFAISHKHALRLEKIFNELYPEFKGKLARVIDSHDPRASTDGGLLDQFKDPNNELMVAISVDMLDTGVDVPECVNLVFAKPVFSRAKFWQMIGRGTRLCENLFGPGKDKEEFLIIDYWNNFAYFKMAPDGKEPAKTESVPERLFRARLEKAEAAIATGNGEILAKTIKEIRQDIDALPDDTVNVKEKASHVAEVREEAAWYGIDNNFIAKLRAQILPLMRTRSAEDFDALKLDTDITVIQTALLNDDNENLEIGREKILKKVGELPLTLNQVRAKEDLIIKVKSEALWNTLNEEKLEELRLGLRNLMKHRQKVRHQTVQLDLADMTLVKEWVEFGPEMERAHVDEYRALVEQTIKDLVDVNPVLQKLVEGQELDEYDVLSLADILRSEDPYITEELLQRVYDNKTARFIDFIRHILGLQKLKTRTEVISKAFDAFISHHNDYSADQIRFIQTLKTFILEQGKAEKVDLINKPFTNIHPSGIRGVFNPSQINELLEFVSQIAVA